MKNCIKTINASKVEIIKTQAKMRNAFVVEIEGSQISNFNEYMYFIEKVLKFPSPCEDIPERYEDWIRDLSWFPYSEYTFIVYNYGLFLHENPREKGWFIDGFKNMILPWWEKDVVNHMVGGETKIMNVYLVE